MQKVALVNSTTDTFKKPRLRDRTDTAWFSRLVTTSGQETEWVYSFNPRACTGQKIVITETQKHTADSRVFFGAFTSCRSFSRAVP